MDKLVVLYKAYGDGDFMFRDAEALGFSKKEFSRMKYNDVVRIRERYRQPVRQGKRHYIPTTYRLRGDVVMRIRDYIDETQAEMKRIAEEK